MGKVARLNPQPAHRDELTAQYVGSAAVRAGGFASPKQLGFIKKLAKDRGLDDLATLEGIHEVLGDTAVVVETLTSQQASRVIEAWKA